MVECQSTKCVVVSQQSWGDILKWLTKIQSTDLIWIWEKNFACSKLKDGSILKCSGQSNFVPDVPNDYWSKVLSSNPTRKQTFHTFSGFSMVWAKLHCIHHSIQKLLVSYFYEGPVWRHTQWRLGREENITPSLSMIWTYDLLIKRRVLYHCSTTTARAQYVEFCSSKIINWTLDLLPRGQGSSLMTFYLGNSTKLVHFEQKIPNRMSIWAKQILKLAVLLN